MDYKEFEKLVITGHGIEFDYNNQRYSISKQPDKYVFSQGDNDTNSSEYTNILQLLVSTRIDEKPLRDIANDMQNIQIY